MAITAFKNATLIDCVSDVPTQGAYVVVEGNIIREVGTGTIGRLPENCEVIDCDGRTLMPGLIDAHIHLNLFDADAPEQTRRNHPSMIVIKNLAVMEDTLLQGFTTALDCGGADAGFREAQAQGMVRGPRLQVCGRSLTQSGGHADMRLPTEIHAPIPHPLSMGVVADGVDQVRRAAREELRMGADYIKIMAAGGCASPADEPDTVQYSMDEMRAAVEEADAVGKIVLAHCYSPRSMQRCARAGVKRVEHGNFMDSETARILKEHDVAYVPTIATYDIMSRRGAEFGIPGYFLRKMKIANERALEALAVAVETGLVVGSGSDMVGPGQPFKGNELELQSRVMGAMGAIHAATRVNAKLMKLDDRIGTIESGKYADLLLLDGDPLKEITLFQNRDRILAIMQGGSFIKLVRP